MKNIKNIVLISLSLLLFSCYEDSGNYDYNYSDINLAEGWEDKFGEGKYVALYGDILTIEPGVENPEKYEYMWIMFHDEIKDTISYEQNLSYELNVSAGTYRIEYYITDKESQHTKSIWTMVVVASKYQDGWYLSKSLKDGGNVVTELDLYQKDGNTLSNLLKNELGKSIEGESKGLHFSPRQLSNEYAGDPLKPTGKTRSGTAIIPYTDSELLLIDVTSFTTYFDMSSLFYAGANPERKVVGFSSSSDSGYTGFSAITTNEGVHMNGIGHFLSGDGRYGNALVVGRNKPALPMSLSEHTSVAGNFSIVFDEENSRFLMAGITATPFLYQYEDDFNSNVADEDKPTLPKSYQVPCKPVCMGITHPSSYFTPVLGYPAYAIMEHNTEDKMFLYTLFMQFNPNENPISKVMEFPSTSNIYKSTHYAINTHYPYLYYGGPNGIYLYDITSNRETQILSNLSGKEITFMKNIFWKKYDSSSTDGDVNKFVVATYEASTDEYTVYIYDRVTATPSGDPIVITGKGKITGAAYSHNQIGVSAHWASYSK